MVDLIRKCVVCGDEFEPSRSNHVSCSDQCNSAKWKKNNWIKNKNYNKKYKADNRDRILEQGKLWKLNNRDKCTMLQNKRRAMKLNAVFVGTDQEYYDFFMEEIYSLSKFRSEITGIIHVVDHILPLINHMVCGLHTPANLRVITDTDNSKKHNKFEEDF